MRLISLGTYDKSVSKTRMERKKQNRFWREILVNAKELSSQEKKKARAKMPLVYGIHDTPFGKCLIGVCEEGICHMSFFLSNPETHMKQFRKIWPNPQNQRDDRKTIEALKGIFFSRGKQPRPAILLLGTRFQLQVWEKLLEAREGETLSYSNLAESIGKPAAVRAVSNAVAGNPVAYLVPCHRVIGKGGDLHGYRWGLDVKKAILEYEGANPIWQ